jgi:hypothetical protein
LNRICAKQFERADNNYMDFRRETRQNHANINLPPMLTMLNRAGAFREFQFTIILPLLVGLLFYVSSIYIIDASGCVSRTGTLVKIVNWLNKYVSFGADDPRESDIMALSFAATFSFGTLKSFAKDVEARRILNIGYWTFLNVISFLLIWGALLQVKICVD